MRHLTIALCLVCGFALAEEPGAVAIRNAKIVTVSGAVIDHGTVVLRRGLITDVGANVTVPADAMVVEGEGLTVYPGLMDGLSMWGTAQATPAAGGGGRGGAGRGQGQQAAQTQAPAAPRSQGPEDRPNTTSWLKIADQLTPSDRRLEAARSAGFTTAATFPMTGIFAGQGAIINLAGEKPGDMVVESPIGQYVTMANSGFSGGFPSSLMGTISYIRQVYLDMAHYDAAKAAYDKNPRGMNRPEYDRALQGVAESKRILLPANRDLEIDRMEHFATELHQNAVLYGMLEAYRAGKIDELKADGRPVLVDLKWPERARDMDPDAIETMRVLEDREKGPAVPGMLAQAGVKFAFYTNGLDRGRDIQRAVKKAMDDGLSRDAAIRAFTLSPAEIYGVADRLGSIEKGKIADLVVTRGDLFDDRAKVEMVFIDGVKYLPAPDAEAPAGRGARGTVQLDSRGGRQ